MPNNNCRNYFRLESVLIIINFKKTDLESFVIH